MPELVGEESGELLQVSTDWWRASYSPPKRIAAAIARVIADWPRRSAAARMRAEKMFDNHVWVDAHRRIFERLLPDVGKAAATEKR